MNIDQLIYNATLAPSGHNTQPCEVESVRKKLSHNLELDAEEEPLLLIRLGYAPKVPRSPRRSLDEVLISGVEK